MNTERDPDTSTDSAGLTSPTPVGGVGRRPDEGLTSPAPAGEIGRRPGEGGSTAEGGCLCGAIRYRVSLPPLWVAHCHCSMCRRAQGAAFVTWFGVSGDRFAFTSTADRLRIYRSSPDATRSFCGRCGTPLFFESRHWPGELHVTLASLDRNVADTLRPQMHAYWRSHVPWVHLADDLPRKDPPDHGEADNG